MDPEKKALWVAALRSGDYLQGMGHLSMQPRLESRPGPSVHCCLGVACVLAVENGQEVEVDKTYMTISYDGETAFLPNSVREWLGLDRENPDFRLPRPMPDGGIRITLSELNDDGWSFTQIADLIERFF